MNISTSENKVKNKHCNERPSTFVSTVTPSQGLIEFFLDNEYKKDNMDHYYNQVMCLDEIDGKFKYFNDLSSNQLKPSLEEDFKNCCNECDQQFDNLLAAQNHYIFNHPNLSMLPKSIPNAYTSINKTMDYNWLDEPLQFKAPARDKQESSNIIIIKNKDELLKKLCRTRNLVRVTEIQNCNSGFTLENIKAHPQEGIRVVKKSDIKFDQLKVQAKQKMIYSKRPEPRFREAPSKKIYEPERQLMKIDINEALKKQPMCNTNTISLTREFLTLLRQPTQKSVKYLCRRCNLAMFDLYVFDDHMKQHMNATFTCPFCTKMFCTQIGVTNHIETCKKESTSANTIVKIVRLSKK